MLMIGVDPHKASHTAVAVCALGELLGTLTVKANERGFFELLRWARAWTASSPSPSRTAATSPAGSSASCSPAASG